jgi:hypothetical protein
MAAKLTRLTHIIAMQLHLVAERAIPFVVLAPGGQSENFWIHTRINQKDPTVCVRCLAVTVIHKFT